MKPRSHTIEDRLQALQRAPILQRLPLEDLHLLAETMGILHLGGGEILFRKDDLGSEAYVVLEGELEGTAGEGEAGNERVGFAIGDFLGKYALFKAVRRTLTVAAVSDCVLMVLPQDRFESLLLVRPEISVMFLKELAGKLAELDQRLHNTTMTARDGSFT